MLKVLKWVIGVPVGLFVLVFVLFAIKELAFGSSTSQPSYFQSQVDDCRRKAKSLYVSGDKPQAIALTSECDALDRVPVKR